VYALSTPKEETLIVALRATKRGRKPISNWPVFLVFLFSEEVWIWSPTGRVTDAIYPAILNHDNLRHICKGAPSETNALV